MAEVPPGRAGLDGALRSLWTDGDLSTGRDRFEAAYRAAQRDADGDAMAVAALGLGGLWVHEHRTYAGAEQVRLRLRQALDAVTPGTVLALRLRIRLAAEADYRAGEHAAALGMLAEARRSGEPVAVADALSLAHHCLLGPDHGRIRRQLAEELVGWAVRTHRPGDLPMGLLWRTADMFTGADPHAERSLAELRELLVRRPNLAVGFVVAAIEVMRAIRAGRFTAARAQAQACLEAGRAAGDADADGWYAGHLIAIAWYAGRIGDLLPMLGDLADSPTLSVQDNSLYAGLAMAAAAAGDRQRAAAALARLSGTGLDRLPRSSTWLATLFGVVECAYVLAEADVAATAYELLSPFARLPATASLGVVCFGSVEHALGMAMLTVGDLDRAVGHLRAAVPANLALGHRPAATLSRSRLAQALARRSTPGDAAEAQREATTAVGEAAALAMVLPESPAMPPAVRASPLTARRPGRLWQIELGLRSAWVEHSLGMLYLSELLANPGREISAAELAAGRADHAVTDAGSRQPVLDDTAIREYRRRLTALQEEIADSDGQPRGDRARDERDWLLAELSTATGLSGRIRRFAGNEERARIAVGKAIRRAVERVTAADPVIGAHLRATVSTGIRCCYLAPS
ncbi:hypothetical protein J2S43_008236 [Catenuloplanes nepalensis]|uniref:Uncharacterized protein n=1 Tax=Catenuloplanes nepalensis TaxID=587533 RepID=A0ABT9N7P6_9ACTN|nr:hypothetical protein [Catenuloplanes nepalensis]MDP9799724.1 hypothetical protein [Catenuloplanes nepalensis]